MRKAEPSVEGLKQMCTEALATVQPESFWQDFMNLVCHYEALVEENERLRVKVWTHGDKCSIECSGQCAEAHTFAPGCWLAASSADEEET